MDINKFKDFKSIDDCPVELRSDFLSHLTSKLVNSEGTHKDYNIWFNAILGLEISLEINEH